MAARCEGFSGAELEGVVNEAAMRVVREGRRRIDLCDLYAAVEIARKSRGKVLRPLHCDHHVVRRDEDGKDDEENGTSVLSPLLASLLSRARDAASAEQDVRE